LLAAQLVRHHAPANGSTGIELIQSVAVQVTLLTLVGWRRRSSYLSVRESSSTILYACCRMLKGAAADESR